MKGSLYTLKQSIAYHLNCDHILVPVLNRFQGYTAHKVLRGIGNIGGHESRMRGNPTGLIKLL